MLLYPFGPVCTVGTKESLCPSYHWYKWFCGYIHIRCTSHGSTSSHRTCCLIVSATTKISSSSNTIPKRGKEDQVFGERGNSAKKLFHEFENRRF